MASGLSDMSPIMVRGENLPSPLLFGNIPMLHDILGEVLEDWLHAVEPYQKQIDAAVSESETLQAITTGFMELQTSFLKSLFSYALFFVAADNAYDYFYKELDRANHLSGLNLKHRKRPKPTPFIRKIQRIRNLSIAHFPSEKAIKKGRAIDAFAGASWQPMALSSDLGRRPDLEKLTFGPGTFRGTDVSGQTTQSQDFEVPGVKTAHDEHCLPYLEHYDEVCCEYLDALQVALN